MTIHEQLPVTPDESLKNPAIARCAVAWQNRYRAVLATGLGVADASREAHAAFRQTMPPLTSPDNLRDFVACVARGLLIGAIENNDAARLFYAAQVAQRAFLRPASAPSEPAS